MIKQGYTYATIEDESGHQLQQFLSETIITMG